MKSFEGFQKGINLGGWISQFDVFDVSHFENFITEDDIRGIADAGYDHVRVPVDYTLLETEDGRITEAGFAYLENCRRWCESFGLHMLIDLHECYGYSFDPSKKDVDKRAFFYDETLQERFLNLWKEIALRFRDYPEQVAFEPLNEVVLEEVADAWNGLLKKYIRQTRSICPQTYLVIGGVCYNSVRTVALIDVPIDDHIVFNFHCYEPMVFTHQGAHWMEEFPADFRIGYPKSLEEYRRLANELGGGVIGSINAPELNEIGPDFFEKLFAPALIIAAARDVPLYCGEYGAIDLAKKEDRSRWMADIETVFDKYKIGHAVWNYKEKDFGLF